MNILREHLIERVPVSDLCDKHQIQPTLFYQWQSRAPARQPASNFFQPKRATHFSRREAPLLKAGAPPPKLSGTRRRKLLALESKLAMRNEALAELMEEHVRLKKTWGGLKDAWTPHDTRGQVIDFINKWDGERTGLPALQIVGWAGIARSKFYD